MAINTDLGEGGRGGGVAMKGYKSKMVVCAPPRHEQQPSSSSSSYPLNQGWTYSTEGRVISWLVKRLRGWGEGGGGTTLPDILLRPPSCRDTTTAIRIKVRPVQRSRANIFRFPSSRGRGRGRGGQTASDGGVSGLIAHRVRPINLAKRIFLDWKQAFREERRGRVDKKVVSK